VRFGIIYYQSGACTLHDRMLTVVSEKISRKGIVKYFDLKGSVKLAADYNFSETVSRLHVSMPE
jgi:hypothetical protein